MNNTLRLQSISYKILKMMVDVISINEAAKKVMSIMEMNSGAYICVSNVHMCMEAFDNSSFCKIVNEADLVVPDGKPLVWAQKLLGAKNASQVRGSDLLLNVCTESERLGGYINK